MTNPIVPNNNNSEKPYNIHHEVDKLVAAWLAAQPQPAAEKPTGPVSLCYACTRNSPGDKCPYCGVRKGGY